MLRRGDVPMEPFDPGANLAACEPDPVDLPRQLAVDDGGYPHRRRGVPEQCRPALIVGVGQAGLQLLTLVKANLVSRFGRVPEQLRLLWLDFEAPDRRPAQYPRDLPDAYCLSEAEKLVLRVDRPEEGEYHCRGIGFDEGDWQRPGRARARAILHRDWGEDGANSRLRIRLQERTKGLKEPDTYVAIPAGDEASGMAGDLPRLIARVVKPAHQTLLLLGTATSQGAGVQEELREAATLLELTRLGLHGGRWRSLYGPQKDAVTDSQVAVANVIHPAIAALPEPRGQVELPSNDPRTSAVGRAADFITCVLAGPFEAYQERRGRAAQNRTERQAVEHRYLLAAVGCEYWRLPVYEAQDLYRAGLLVGFFGPDGILDARPPQGVDLDRYVRGNAWHRILDIALSEEEAGRVAGDQYVFQRGDIRRLVERSGNVFEVALENALNRLFEGGESPCNALGRAVALLDQVSRRLEATQRILMAPRRRPSEGRAGWPVPYAQLPEAELEPLRNWYCRALGAVKQARASIDAWHNVREQLLKKAKDERTAAKGIWSWQRGLPGVDRALQRAGADSIDRALGEVDPEAIVKRWRWTWREGAPVLCGFSLRARADGGAGPSFARLERFTHGDAHRLWKLAQEHAAYYSRVVLDWPDWNISRCWEKQDAAKALVDEASPLSDFRPDVVRALSVGEVAVSWFLWVPEQAEVQDLQQGISDPDHLVARTWQDPYAVALLSYVECIPVESLDVWRHAGHVPPGELLFRPEQAMRRIEEKLPHLLALARSESLVWSDREPEQMLPTCWGKPWQPNPQVYEPILHSEFRTWLEAGDRAELFAEAFLLGLVPEENDRWLLRFKGVEVELAKHLLDALERFSWAPEGFGSGPFQGEDSVQRMLQELRQALDGSWQQANIPDAILKCLRDVQQRAERDGDGRYRLLWPSFRNWLYLCALERVRQQREGR